MADPTAMPGHGCNIEGKFYMDGMQVCIIQQIKMDRNWDNNGKVTSQ